MCNGRHAIESYTAGPACRARNETEHVGVGHPFPHELTRALAGRGRNHSTAQPHAVEQPQVHAGHMAERLDVLVPARNQPLPKCVDLAVETDNPALRLADQGDFNGVHVTPTRDASVCAQCKP